MFNSKSSLGKCDIRVVDKRAMALASDLFKHFIHKEEGVSVESTPDYLRLYFKNVSLEKCNNYVKVLSEGFAQDEVIGTWSNCEKVVRL